jgi:hypothetical protein
MIEDCCEEGYDESNVELAAVDCEVESGQIAEEILPAGARWQ